MSMTAACGWSLARSVLVAALALPLCLWLQRRLITMRGPVRTVGWCALVLPFLFPTLLSGYAYSGVSLKLVNGTWWSSFIPALDPAFRQWVSANHSVLDELILSMLLLTRSVPVGTLLLALAPLPSYSPTAWHCRKLATRPHPGRAIDWRAHFEYWRYGPSRNLFAAFGLVFLVAFQEFELPSLLNRPAWTVWLFDAQVGGLALFESLRAAITPLICEVAIVIPLWRSLANQRVGVPARRSSSELRRSAGYRDASYLAAAIVVTCVLPLSLVGRGVLEGLQALAINPAQLTRVLRNVFFGTLFAIPAAVIAVTLSDLIGRRRRVGRFLSCLALPGLFGPLLLSLALVRVLQGDWLHALYGTSASLLIGLTLFLLPRAMLVQALLQAARPHQARHTATLLAEAAEANRRGAARDLAWQLGHKARFWTVGVLTLWAYLELTVASLLGPVGIVSVPVLLYNQMHFGKNATLSATTAIAIVLPVAMFACAAMARPLVFRLLWR